ncbi:MAG: cytochrome c [Acidobacteria bacterium]|nr:cytochrome c [Acidobacteriota bacterium]
MPAPVPTFQAREGARLFASFCAPCHGETGRGDGTYLAAGVAAVPPDFAEVEVAARLRKERLLDRLSATAPAGESHCPPWGDTFTPEEVQTLAAWAETLGRSGAGGELPLPESEVAPKESLHGGF